MLQILEATSTDTKIPMRQRDCDSCHHSSSSRAHNRNCKRYRHSKRFAVHSPLVSAKAVTAIHDHRIPLYHLKGKESHRYTVVDDSDNLFEVKLEILNRRAVRKVKRPHPEEHITDLSDYFYECAGKAKVTPKLCTKCRDINKNPKRYDLYYIDIMEISQQRTIFCVDCMKSIVNKTVRGELADVIDELNLLRLLQPHGIYIDPFSVSCGL